MKSLISTLLLLAGVTGLAQAQRIQKVTIDFKTRGPAINGTSQVEVQLLTGLNVLVAEFAPAPVPAIAPAPAQNPKQSITLDLGVHTTTLSDLRNAKLSMVLYPLGVQQDWTFDFDIRVTFDDNSTRIYNFYDAKLTLSKRTYTVTLP